MAAAMATHRFLERMWTPSLGVCVVMRSSGQAGCTSNGVTFASTAEVTGTFTQSPTDEAGTIPTVAFAPPSGRR